MTDFVVMVMESNGTANGKVAGIVRASSRKEAYQKIGIKLEELDAENGSFTKCHCGVWLEKTAEISDHKQLLSALEMSKRQGYDQQDRLLGG